MRRIRDRRDVDIHSPRTRQRGNIGPDEVDHVVDTDDRSLFLDGDSRTVSAQCVPRAAIKMSTAHGPSQFFSVTDQQKNSDAVEPCGCKAREVGEAPHELTATPSGRVHCRGA